MTVIQVWLETIFRRKLQFLTDGKYITIEHYKLITCW